MNRFIFLFFLLVAISHLAISQVADTNIGTKKDSILILPGRNIYKQLLDSNHLLNANATPQSLSIEIRNSKNKNGFFYTFLLLALVVGTCRYFFSKYFNTLFKVFFNTSLRQNQLTDQLEQSKLPSLIFNVFFIISTGLYLYFISSFSSIKSSNFKIQLALFFIIGLGVCYVTKYFGLIFIGWLTGKSSEANTYLFIVFLMNKMIGIFLLPVSIVICFAKYQIAYSTILISLIGIGLMLFLRFFRSFALIKTRLNISNFHFILYAFGVEIFPIILLYKGIMHYLLKFV